MPPTGPTRAARIPLQRPAPSGGTSPAWGTLGTAIDHRLRLALRSENPRTRAVAAGIAMAGDHHPVLGRTGLELLDEIDRLIGDHQPDDRTRPIPRSGTAEDRLARACYTAALFEEVFRSGRIWPSTALGRAGDDLTLEQLLDQVPDYAVLDLTAMVDAADTALAVVRAAAVPEDVVLGPVFAGSADVGGADADWIADRTLIDVKATITPTTLSGREMYQLAGYLLLDYDDVYRIERLGWYHARDAALTTWDTGRFLTLLGARRPLAELRGRLRLELALS